MKEKTLTITLALILLMTVVPVFTPTASAFEVAINVPNWDHMIVATIDEPESVDPAWGYDAASVQLIMNVYDTLISFNYESVVAFELHLADSYTIVDPLTYRFHIRPNVQWQDPTFGIVTPRDVEYSFERGMVMDPLGGPEWLFYQPLLDMMSSRDIDLTDSTAALNLVQSIDNAIQIVDASGNPNLEGEYVQFNLAIPFAPFMTTLAQFGRIIDLEWARDVEGAWNGIWPTTGAGAVTLFEDYNDPAISPFDDPVPTMMGSGPYKLDDYEAGDHWRIKRFPDYYMGWPAPGCTDYVSMVTVKYITNWPARKVLFTSTTAEQVDLADVPTVNYPEVILDLTVRGAKNLPTLITDQISFTENVNPVTAYIPKLGASDKLDLLMDIHMRKGLVHAFNYAQYIINGRGGEAVTIATPFVAGLLGAWNSYADWASYTPNYDLNLAKWHFMMAYGGSDPDGYSGPTPPTPGQAWTQGFTLQMFYGQGNLPSQTAAVMLENAVENLITGWGVQPTITSTGIGGLYSKAALGLLPIFIGGWIPDYADPHDNAVAYMQTTAGFFSSGQHLVYDGTKSGYTQIAWTFQDGKVSILGAPINNTYVDALIGDGPKLINTADRLTIYHELNRIWYAEAIGIMIDQRVERHWERTWVQGWYYNPLLPGYYFYHLWKGLDADMSGRDPTNELFTRGFVDSKELSRLNFYWYDPISGAFTPGGYYRVVDIYRPGRNFVPVDVTGNGGSTDDIKADTQEMDGAAFEFGLPQGYYPARGDGFIDLWDKALFNAQWHDYVV